MPTAAQLLRRTQEVAVLSSVAELLTSLDLDVVLSKTLSLLTNTVGAERGSFFVFSEHNQTAERYITRRNLSPERSHTVVGKVIAEGLAGWVYRHQKAALVADTLLDNRWVTLPDDASPVRSVLCVPFMTGDAINGIMTLEHSKPQFFDEDDLQLATAVAHQASVALRNAQLFNQVESQERQLNAVLQSTVNPILTVNPAGEIKLANVAVQKAFGISAAMLIGKRLAGFSRRPLFAELARLIEQGLERFDLTDPETNRDYQVQVSSWQSSDAPDRGYVIVLNDVTAYIELDRLKSQMIQIASHDLKNPLGVVQGYAELMLMEMDPAHEYREFVTDIAKTTERMLEMVSQLLNVERIETTAEGETQEDFDPLAMIQALIAELRPTALRKQQTLTEMLPHTAVTLHGDPPQLREAFKNLLDNALKYTPDGGMIVVQATVDPVARQFHYAVEDNGYGISEERQADIFQRFYRAKEPGTEAIPGTGLGLSLVKAVVERHGGKIWFESSPERGSTFGFWLPLPDDAREQQRRIL